jgi:hypothetical protein
MIRYLSVCFILTIALGCSSSQHQVSVVESNIGQLSIYYGQFRQANQGRVPKDEAEFKGFLQKLPGFDEAKVTEMLTSPRDKQPYVVRYKAPPPPQGVVMHEATGLNGIRFAVNINGAVLELDEAQFQSLRITGS